jgi:ABC-type antimicrobial peptide transport system permease subunit
MFLFGLKKQWRIIRKRKIYYFINIFGLALGIASSVLIMLWIADEMSFEKMHENADRIMQLHKEYNMGGQPQINSSLPMPLAPSLIEEFPEISEAVRVVPQRATIRYGETAYNENNICATDQSYFSVFSIEFVQGDPSTALLDPYSMVISREKAEKYFGIENPLGRVLEYAGELEFTITGIIENIEGNTALDFDMIVPAETLYIPGSEDDSWYNHFFRTYICLGAPIQRDTLNARLTRHMRSYMPDNPTLQLLAFPIRDMHLHDPTVQSPRATYVYIFTVIGFLVLLIACINFTNVSTFVSLQRSKEIGVRKINGGGKWQLVSQFFGETFQQTFLGLVVGMMLVELFRSQFNELTGKSITIPYLEPWFILSLAGIIIVTTLLAGTYPAMLISAFKPVDAFRGRIISGKGQSRFRTFLVVLQFAISAGLIISTLTIFGQLKYMQNKDLGFDKENLIYLSLDAAQENNFTVFREKLLSHQGIEGVCMSSSLPTSIWNVIRGLTWEGYEGEDIHSFAFLSGDVELLETLGLEVISGRGFSREFSTDSSCVLINEEAAKLMGFEDPVGKAFVDDSSIRTEIIGVFRNFHGLPLTEPLEPMIITLWEQYTRYALVRLGPGNPEEAISHIEEVWTSLYPSTPFNHNFMDEHIEQQYRSELRIGKLSGAFTILAILITCIGLFAIAGHSAQRKNKEIGIRKSMGASGNSIITQFVLNYIKWVGIANLMAWPLAWIFMRNWLHNFAFRTEIRLQVFVYAALISAVVSALTVAWHAWNTSRTDPVLALKCE